MALSSDKIPRFDNALGLWEGVPFLAAVSLALVRVLAAWHPDSARGVGLGNRAEVIPVVLGNPLIAAHHFVESQARVVMGFEYDANIGRFGGFGGGGAAVGSGAWGHQQKPIFPLANDRQFLYQSARWRLLARRSDFGRLRFAISQNRVADLPARSASDFQSRGVLIAHAHKNQTSHRDVRARHPKDHRLDCSHRCIENS